MYRLCLSFLFFVASTMGAFGDKLEITIKGEGANGIVVIDLFEEIAPLHVERMLALASNGNYDGIVFHRVIEGFMAQTGDVQFGKLGDDIENAGRGGSSMPDLVAEFSNIPFDRGVVGMARAQNPNSANSQFFIMFKVDLQEFRVTVNFHALPYQFFKSFHQKICEKKTPGLFIHHSRKRLISRIKLITMCTR